ncbi:MAG TPA: DUF3732 domain-containing protein [Blastocatellia bacterium]|nr:DUF3732 domain-containing protein [Blastocatellia bacterium]HMV82613.1 DUF3732 domain-containing protein [Blastocatellia bacterium]HMX29340.1 DUF3732 domain-containing protein [Blastocatellia bacterium]HMY71990.1 DUF3732 domain-containing protein [Blastocatellia bacterium]HMZ18666.1 DUF3732 domain-containing protein [Blastocatellia bacterium]
MQILEIVLYGRQGQKRVLPLQAGKTNIITGGSATGKSALIQIVDYCLGRGECTVPEGVIRESVSWFGLRLQFASGQVFVARQNPPKGRTTTNRAYFEEGTIVPSPDAPPAQPNTVIEALEDLLTDKLGIAPNMNFPAPGQTRSPLAANIRHALVYCFQQQSEIASKDVLFHGQYDGWVAQAIKDTIAYFLGAIQEDRLALEQELARARRELKRAEQSLREAEAITGDGVSKAGSLYQEARHVGLLPDETIPENLEVLRTRLQEVLRWTPEADSFPGSERLTQFQEEVRTLQIQAREKADAANAARSFAQEAEGYLAEARQQELRLESIGLFDAGKQNAHACPVCTQELDVPVPTAEAMRRSLEQLKANLENTVRERPRLRRHIESLEKEREEIRQRIREKNEDIRSLLAEQQAAAQLRELNVRRGRVIGRISLWLESVDTADTTSQLREDVRQKHERVATLEQQLEDGEKQERLFSILNRIGVQMTDWANNLELEHSRNPVRLDLSKLTVLVDRDDRPIPLNHMGSGANWVGFHLIAHLALHRHFVQHGRPVPAFLFLDQPSQVYYPPDKDTELQGSLAGIGDEDQLAVSRMYNLIFDVVENLSPNFQVVVTDHADLAEARFQSVIAERWRGGQALVPQDWINVAEPPEA